MSGIEKRVEVAEVGYSREVQFSRKRVLTSARSMGPLVRKPLEILLAEVSPRELKGSFSQLASALCFIQETPWPQRFMPIIDTSKEVTALNPVVGGLEEGQTSLHLISSKKIRFTST